MAESISPTTASQVSNASQMSTQPIRETQEIASQGLDTSMIDETVWGRLLAMRQNVKVYNLSDDCYTFGRGSVESGSVDHQFNENTFDSTLLPVISKQHFRIRREVKKTNGKEDQIVIIEDLSSNGTFVNQKLIGKRKSTVLNNNDEIGMAQPNKKVFIFHDCVINDAAQYPAELTSKYTIARTLGEGTFGEVKLAYKHGNLERCAVKILKKKMLSSNGDTLLMSNISQIQNEVLLLQSIDHPCIVRLWDVIESPERIYLVMEIAEGGELFDRIKSSGHLNEPIAKLYCYQLALAIHHLHSQGITHRDLKPENILLSCDGLRSCVKLTDFGMSKLTLDASAMSTFCGTQMYLAPELIQLTKKIKYTNKVDLWSFGVVLFVCLAGYPPFYDVNDINIKYLIRTATFNFNKPVWTSVSDTAKHLIEHLLVPDPEYRYDAVQTLEHPWFKDDEDMRKEAEELMKKAADPPTIRCSPPTLNDSMTSNKRPFPNDCTETTLKMQDAKTPRLVNHSGS